MSELNQTATEGIAINSAAAEHAHFDSSSLSKIMELAASRNAVVSLDGTTKLLAPQDYRLHDLTAEIEVLRPNPSRKKGVAQLNDLASFLTYVKQQGNPAITRIYADVDRRSITAVFNDHANVNESDKAGWRDHGALFRAEISPEFTKWMENDGKSMDQETFAVFIEDNIADIADAGGETLLTVASTLQAKNEVQFASSHRLDNGQVQLAYTENITATAGGNGSVQIPREFAIGARLFKGGAGYKIHARLKFRLIGGGKVKFWYELDRPHIALEDAFNGYVQQIRADGTYTVLNGKV